MRQAAKRTETHRGAEDTRTGPAARKRTVPSTIYDKKYYLTINDGGALGKQDNTLSPRLAYMAKLADVRKGDVVLDVGCGTGELAFFCARKGATVYGIDYSKDAIAMSKRKLARADASTRKRVTFLHGSATDIDKMPLPRGRITKVIMTDIVEHLYPEQLETTMRKIHELIAEGAVVYVHTAPNLHFYRYGYPLIRWSYPLARHIGFVRNIIETKPNWKGRTRLPKDPEEGSHNKQGHVNEQTPGSLVTLLKRTGYRTKVWTLPFLRDVYGLKVRLVYYTLRVPPLNLMFCSEIVCIARKDAAKKTAKR